MLQIIQVPPAAVEIAQGIRIDMPAVAYAGIDDGVVVGAYGLAWGEGRCWAWLQLRDGKPQYARTVVRRTKALLEKAWQLGEREVYTPRDAQFQTSGKLLTVLGFTKAEVINGIEVWKISRGDAV